MKTTPSGAVPLRGKDEPLATFCPDHNDGEQRSLATFWRPLTPGVAYVRCVLPARYLPGKVINMENHLRGEGANVAVDRRVLDCEAAVFSIPGARTEGRIMEALWATDTPAFVEVDDNYTVPYDAPSEWRAEINADDARSIEAHKRIVANQASGIICSTDRLGEIYSDLHENVHVCPNTIDPGDWPPHPFELKPSTKDGILRVGFAGSPSHMPDLELVRKALRWCAEQKGVEVVMLGSWQAGGVIRDGKMSTGIDPGFPHRTIPWTDKLGEYHFNLSELDIGLAPLVDTSWAAGKSDLKVLEYAMAGVCPVASDAIPFRPWVGTDVPLCKTANDFLHVVQELVADPDRMCETALAARRKVLAERTTIDNIWRWREALDSGR